ncbi:hypothetical protein AVEN_12467-1 [Araneus ventricosus]|uniref:Uncharacterized protein n=1 Tax=Araneus ventricosus TaxID=182803 RepID=A0A4Y2IRZ9_ARAVE|nr:hypothetical protein AVEN_12467-1 [Araneus ventricosus]
MEILPFTFSLHALPAAPSMANWRTPPILYGNRESTSNRPTPAESTLCKKKRSVWVSGRPILGGEKETEREKVRNVREGRHRMRKKIKEAGNAL